MQVGKRVAEPEDDAAVAEADSPWLERKRMWDARKARLVFLELRGLLVRIDVVERLWAVVGGLLQARLSQMCPECRAVAEATLEQAGEQFDTEFPQVGEFGPDDYELLDEPEAGPEEGPAGAADAQP